MSQILNIDVVGQKLYDEYVAERINGNVSLWEPVKKHNNKMYLSDNKKTKVMLGDKMESVWKTGGTSQVKQGN